MSKTRTNELAPFSSPGIGIGGPSISPAVLLNIQSTTQGIAIPRMTTAQRNLIAAPFNGLFVYNTDTNGLEHYNGATWESDTGLQSLNGLTAKTQTFANGFSGTAPNFVSSGTIHTLNIPLASATAVTGGLITKGEYDTFNTRSYPIKNVKCVVKNATLGPQDYNSVADALASISDASSSNPYVIYIGPGIFTESQLIMKPFVALVGMDDSSSVIKASTPSVPLIIGSHSSQITDVQLVGPTDAGVPLIYYTGMAASANAFSVIHCSYQTADLVYHIENNNTFPTIFRTEDCRVVSTSAVGAILLVEGAGSSPLFCFMKGFIYRRMSAPYPNHLMDLSGSQARVVLDGILIETNSSVSHGIHVEDGVNLGVLNTVLSGLDIGFHVHNVGAAPLINTSNFVIRNCTQDILIEHPGTMGSLNGASDITKTTVDDLAPITLSMVDPANGGTFDTGALSLGRKVSFLTNVSDLLEGEPAMGIITGGFLGDLGGFDVEVGAGFGYAQVDPFPDHRIRRLDWPTTTVTLSANQDVYIYVNSSGILTVNASIGNTTNIILIGRVVTNGTGIELIDQSPMLARHFGNYLNRMLRDALGPIYDNGSIVTENVTPFKINVTAGAYFFSYNRYTPSGGTAQSFTQYYRDGLGAYNSSITDLVNSTDWDDNSGSLVPLTSGYFVKHTLYVNCDDTDEKYFLVIGQAEYSALAAVESAPLPTPPSWIKDAVTPIASIVIEEGNPNIVEFLDIRPVIGFKSSGVSASADHGNLLGLADDDHPQYLLASGSRSMSGNLNMGGNNITNAGTVNGVTVQTHGSRHLPAGADPITTAAPTTPLSGDTLDATGTANSLARSDHSHSILTGTASAILPDQANTPGISPNLSRADHGHNVPTAAPSGTIGANSANGQGVAANFSRSDHQHQLATGTPITITPDQANAAGSSNNLSRADHVHAIVTAAPVSVADANTQGSASSFSRSDHQHAHGLQTNPAQHAVATTIANGFLSSTDKTKLDGLPTSAVPTSRTLTAGAGMTGGGDLSADRTFDVVANGDGSILVNPNDIQVGVLATDAQHGTRGGGTQHAAATTSVNGFMSSTDKTKLDGIPASAVPTSRTLTAGAGLTGGGDLSADRTFDVVANADGSIVANANDIQVGVLATDAQHGVRGGGTQHAAVTTSVNGFMSAADKTKLNGLPTSAVPTTRTLTAGNGLTGGGDLSADRTFDVVANADGSIVANANDIQVGVLATDAQHGVRGGGTQHAAATTSVNGFMSAADKTKLDGIGGARIIKSGIVAGASFAGNPKTFAVVFGTAFPTTNYTIAITGANNRTWNYQSKATTGFTINANANAALAGEVSWTAISTGETVE